MSDKHLTDKATAIRKLIAEQAGIDETKVTDDASLLDESIGFDSLDIVELVMTIEEKFDIGIADADAEQFKITKDVIDYVTKATSAT